MLCLRVLRLQDESKIRIFLQLVRGENEIVIGAPILMCGIDIKIKGLVEPILFLEPLVGFEPTTPRLQITCSGQLS